MRHFNGLQVKEIPIIFRGGIEAAETPGEEIEITAKDLDGNNIHGQDQYGQVIAQVVNPEELTISKFEYTRNGESYKYSDLPKTFLEGAGIWVFGSMYDADAGEWLDPNYPLTLAIVPIDEENTQIQLVIDKASTPSNAKATPAAYTVDYVLQGMIGGGDPAPAKKTMQFELTGNGSIKRFYVRFAVGENGTLHINPYVILNGNIRIDLCNFADGGFKYINGDDETISFDCYVPVETHALACIDVENVGEYPSIIDAAMVVQYEDFIEPESIVGYEGINLRK